LDVSNLKIYNGDIKSWAQWVKLREQGYEGVSGDFRYAGDEYITSLIGSPVYIGGHYDCSRQGLSSLEGIPVHIGGDINVCQNDLGSLKGIRSEVYGSLAANECKLTSLEYSPLKVAGDLEMHYNLLKSLRFSPIIVGGIYNVQHNQLRTLEGAPDRVHSLYAAYNELVSLIGSPEHIEECMDVRRNNIVYLAGSPIFIGVEFNASENNIVSLKDSPEVIVHDVDYSKNRLTSLEGLTRSIKSINCSENQLISLEFIPQYLFSKEASSLGDFSNITAFSNKFALKAWLYQKPPLADIMNMKNYVTRKTGESHDFDKYEKEMNEGWNSIVENFEESGYSVSDIFEALEVVGDNYPEEESVLKSLCISIGSGKGYTAASQKSRF